MKSSKRRAASVVASVVTVVATAVVPGATAEASVMTAVGATTAMVLTSSIRTTLYHKYSWLGHCLKIEHCF